MCQFFSFVTDPINHPAEYYFFDWVYRKANLEDDGVDSHSHICAYYKLNEDKCNKYEYSPVTGEFVVDQINSKRDDSNAAEKWAQRLDFKTIIEPLIIKPIVNPFTLPMASNPTDEQIGWLKEWDSVWTSVRDSVWTYSSSFFAINYEYDFSSAVKLWESGLVPSFDGKTWRLHTGKDARVVYEWTPEVTE
jgi:hypothetical protein